MLDLIFHSVSGQAQADLAALFDPATPTQHHHHTQTAANQHDRQLQVDRQSPTALLQRSVFRLIRVRNRLPHHVVHCARAPAFHKKKLYQDPSRIRHTSRLHPTRLPFTTYLVYSSATHSRIITLTKRSGRKMKKEIPADYHHSHTPARGSQGTVKSRCPMVGRYARLVSKSFPSRAKNVIYIAVRAPARP